MRDVPYKGFIYQGVKELTTDYVSCLKSKNVWGGDIFVAVCEPHRKLYREEMFFVCEVKGGKLICTKTPTVEMSDDAESLKKRYIEFRDAFTNALQVYKKDKKKQVVLDVDDLNSFDN